MANCARGDAKKCTELDGEDANGKSMTRTSISARFSCNRFIFVEVSTFSDEIALEQAARRITFSS